MQSRSSRQFGVRSFRRQKTLSHETAAQEKKGGGFTIKNLLYQVKLKTRVRQIVHDLSSRRWKLLNFQHFKLINDKSFYPSEEAKKRLSFYNGYDEDDNIEEDEEEVEFNQNTMKRQLTRQPTRNLRNRSASKNILEKIKWLLEIIPIINPNSVSKLLWDSFQSLLGLFLSVVVPLKLAIQDFELSYYVGSPFILSFMIILIMSDIIINLNTAFFKKGKIEVHRFLIFKNYMNQMGIYDALITQALVWELWGTQKTWFETTESILLCAILYLKVLKLHKLIFKIEETFSFNRRTLNVLSLAKLLVFIVKVSHAFACLWVFIGRSMISSGNSSWIEPYANKGWESQYLQAYYFISVTMTTIGFGDIVPKNPVETFVCIFSMIIACVIFGYTINIIGSIFMELKKEDDIKKENLLIINRYMNEKSISRDLQSSIREYLEYFWKQQQNDNSEKEAHILDQLSEDMKQALLIQANRIILEDCQFLKRHFSRDVIQKSVHLIKQKKLTPNESIINSYDDQAKSGLLFFVENGEVDIYQEFLLDELNQDLQSVTPEGEENNNPHGSIPQYNINGQPISAPPISQAILQLAQGEKSSEHQQIKAKKKYIKRVRTVKKGDFFGEVSFFTNFPHTFIAKSRTFTKILFIERSKFLEFLQNNHFSDDIQSFCYLRDSLIQNQFQPLFTKCQLCNSYDHSALTCSMVHYYPVRTLAISKYNFSQSIIVRTPLSRRDVDKKNSLFEMGRIEEIADRFAIKNESFIVENYNFIEGNSSEMSNSSSDDSDSNSDDPEKKSRQETAAAVYSLTHPKRSQNMKKNDSSDYDDDSNIKFKKYDLYDDDEVDDDYKIKEDDNDLLISQKLHEEKKNEKINRPKARSLYKRDDQDSSENLQIFTKRNAIIHDIDEISTEQNEFESPKTKHSKGFLFQKMDYPKLILPGDPEHISIYDQLKKQEMQGENQSATETMPKLINKFSFGDNKFDNKGENKTQKEDKEILNKNTTNNNQEFLKPTFNFLNIPDSSSQLNLETKLGYQNMLKIQAGIKKCDSIESIVDFKQEESTYENDKSKVEDNKDTKVQNHDKNTHQKQPYAVKITMPQFKGITKFNLKGIMPSAEPQRSKSNSGNLTLKKDISKQSPQNLPKLTPNVLDPLIYQELSSLKSQFPNLNNSQDEAADYSKNGNNNNIDDNKFKRRTSKLIRKQSLESKIERKSFMSINSNISKAKSSQDYGKERMTSILVVNQTPQDLRKQNKSIFSHSAKVRNSFICQPPLRIETPQQKLRRLSNAYFNVLDDKQHFQQFPKVNNNKKQQDETSSPQLVGDHLNKKQKMQTALAKTLEKMIEQENQSQLNGRQINTLEEDDSNLNVQTTEADPMQQQQPFKLFQNWDAKFVAMFEQMKIFKNYFPMFNYDKVILKMKKKRQEQSTQKNVSRWQRGMKKSNTILTAIQKDKEKDTSPLKESSIFGLEKKERGNQRKNSNVSSNILKPPTLNTITDLDINMSPSVTQTNLLNVNLKKCQFQPMKSNVTSPLHAFSHKLSLNRITNDDFGFSDDEFQTFQKSSKLLSPQKIEINKLSS